MQYLLIKHWKPQLSHSLNSFTEKQYPPMARTKALSRDSHLNVVKLVSELSEAIPLPAGVSLRDESEMVIWRQFTQSRTRDGWREVDLITVGKCVRLEADIRKHQSDLDQQGALLLSDKGAQVLNPLVGLVDLLQRQQLTLTRSISLNQTKQNARTLNGQGAEQIKLRKQMAVVDDFIP